MILLFTYLWNKLCIEELLPAVRTVIFLSFGTIQGDENPSRHKNQNEDIFLGSDLITKMKTEFVSLLNSVKLLNTEFGTCNFLVEKVPLFAKYFISHNLRFPDRGPPSGRKTDTLLYFSVPIYVHFNASLFPGIPMYVSFPTSLPFWSIVFDCCTSFASKNSPRKKRHILIKEMF